MAKSFQMFYWSDVKERVIYRSQLGSESKEVFLGTEAALGFVDGRVKPEARDIL